jgi:hypothetical protein
MLGHRHHFLHPLFSREILVVSVHENLVLKEFVNVHHHLLHQLLFTVEIVVDAAFQQADSLADIRHSCLVIALLAKHF